MRCNTLPNLTVTLYLLLHNYSEWGGQSGPIAVNHKVLSWSFKPAVETYREMCSEMELTALESVADALGELQLLAKV